MWPNWSNHEVNTYKWREDKDGNYLDDPVKFADHLMDALRYAIHTHCAKEEVFTAATGYDVRPD